MLIEKTTSLHLEWQRFWKVIYLGMMKSWESAAAREQYIASASTMLKEWFDFDLPDDIVLRVSHCILKPMVTFDTDEGGTQRIFVEIPYEERPADVGPTNFNYMEPSGLGGIIGFFSTLADCPNYGTAEGCKGTGSLAVLRGTNWREGCE